MRIQLPPARLPLSLGSLPTELLEAIVSVRSAIEWNAHARRNLRADSGEIERALNGLELELGKLRSILEDDPPAGGVS